MICDDCVFKSDCCVYYGFLSKLENKCSKFVRLYADDSETEVKDGLE